MKTIALALALVSNALAGIVTLTMDEVPTQSIDGLTVSKGGEDFTFSNPSGTLFYDSSGPGIVTYVQDPSIQGSTAPFGVAFSVPVFSIQFGLAEDVETSVSPLATVSLFDSSLIPFATISFDSSLVDPFAEVQFNYSGGPITNILITPNSGPAALAFDNLTVDTVPEPSTFSLFAGVTGFAAATMLVKRVAKRQLANRAVI
jgi:hypothetical protein